MANGHTCVERSIQDAKSELGWDEFQAQKLRAWEHQLALTVPASWLIAQTRLDSAQGFPPDHRFAGNKGEQIKQIGNAVPPGLARALTLTAMGAA